MRNAEVQKQKDEWRRKKKEDEERLAAEHKAVKEQMETGIAQKQSQTFELKKAKHSLVKIEKEVLPTVNLGVARETDIDDAADGGIDGEDTEEAADPEPGTGTRTIEVPHPGIVPAGTGRRRPKRRRPPRSNSASSRKTRNVFVSRYPRKRYLAWLGGHRAHGERRNGTDPAAEEHGADARLGRTMSAAGAIGPRKCRPPAHWVRLPLPQPYLSEIQVASRKEEIEPRIRRYYVSQYPMSQRILIETCSLTLGDTTQPVYDDLQKLNWQTPQ